MQQSRPMTGAQTGDDDNIAVVSSIAYGFMGSQALFAALELGLFTALATSPLTESEIAQKTGARLDPLRSLLAACVALQLLERDGGVYRNTQAAQRYLVRNTRGYMGDYYLNQIAETLYLQMPLTRAALRGQPGAGGYADFLNDPARTELFIRGQHAGSSGPAYLLAKTVDLSPYGCLLDLGGGSGAFAIEAVRRYSNLSAIVLDQPQVVAHAETFIAEAGFASRIRCAAGDVVNDEWPKGSDLILLSYVISSYRPDVLRKVLSRAHDYLPAGGALIVHDFAMHGDRPGPRNAALWSFANLAISATTHPHTVKEIAEAMTDAGFAEVTARPYIPDITFLFTGRRS
jgi:2-hydroxy-4-(methylsulfanyl)butanoate S-methyltransferase